MDSIERLTALFEKFPGIGPRQAGRFVQYLLRTSPSVRRELADATRALGENVRQCRECMRYFAGKEKTCDICTDTRRDAQFLTVVAADADLAALEKSGAYRGLYFVIGGTLSLASEKTDGLRIKELIRSIPPRIKRGLKEVVLAFPANPEGDATATRLREDISAIAEGSLKISALGRGLSTGSELEYADPDTIKNALDNRK